MKEKKISPKKRKIEINIENNKLKLRIKRARVDKKNETKVPDHVFLGLILGNIRGPLILDPIIYAVVSLKNEIHIIK